MQQGKIEERFQSKVVVLWFEEIDFICQKNQELMYEFLAEIDTNQMLILATTNQLDKIDKAIRRGGRLDIDIRMDMPSDRDRYLIFKEHFKNLPNDIEDEDLLMISRASSGFVSSDIA